MQTRQEMETELSAQLQSANNSNMFPSSRITTLIQNAYRWATTLYIWNALVKGKTTSTQANHEYYDYPEELRNDTIMRLTIDGVPYARKNFEDYLQYKYNHPNGTLKMFANFGRQFFVHPTPTTTGSSNLDVWGAVDADELSSSSSTTIFSTSREDANEAVVRKALSVAIKRTDQKLSESEEKAAIAILAKYNLEEQKSRQRDQRIEHPKFNVPNFFPDGHSSSPIGAFNYDPSIEE